MTSQINTVGEIYNEKLIETFIKDYPDLFLGEKLTLLQQQPRIGGFIPDLIFKDESGIVLIVEVQKNALDRKHLYKTIEYGHLYKVQYNESNLRLMLVCNSISEKYIPILDAHKVEHIILPKNKFLELVKKKIPHFQLQEELEETSQNPTGEYISIGTIINCLRLKRMDLAPTEIDATVFYSYAESHAVKCSPNFNLNLEAQKTEKNPLYFDLPYEVIVCNDFLKSINIAKIEMLLEWVTILDSYIGFKKDGEIILGFRCSPDILDYDDYLKGFIKKFSNLFFRYQNNDYATYNLDKLSDDLNMLGKPFLYFGGNSNLVAAPLFTSYRIEQSTGILGQKFEDSIPDKVKFNKARGVSAKEINKYLALQRADLSKYQFITVHFTKFNRLVLRAIEDLCRHLRNGHNNFSKNQLVISRQCSRCILTPLQLKDISDNALFLTNKYFSRYYIDKYVI